MLRSVSVLIALSLSITGCATKYSESYNQNQTEQNSSEKNILEQVEENTVDSESTFIEAEKRYATALKANMAFYSPRNIQNAKESLKLARAQELNAEKEASLKSSKNLIIFMAAFLFVQGCGGQVFLKKVKLSSEFGDVIYIANQIKGFNLNKKIVKLG